MDNETDMAKLKNFDIRGYDSVFAMEFSRESGQAMWQLIKTN